MNNLYRIVNKEGDSVPLRLNAVQADVLINLHSRNLILKARQLGMSTFAVLYLLDEALFVDNTHAGIVSYSLEHAQHIFKRIIGHALDSLKPVAKKLAGVVQRSAREISFSNGSFLRVDTTLRGGAYQLVLVSEFGKTCARNPLKAEEVITGTLPSVPTTGRIIIESTAEGSDGFFSEMVSLASQRGNDELTNIDYKFFFYPWMSDPSYFCAGDLTYPIEMTDYFNRIEIKTKSIISPVQRNWYVKQESLLGDKIKQEFPSTIEESFSSSSDAYYYQQLIEKTYQESRCLQISPYDALEPVYVSMDIGVNDLTVIIFFQTVHGEIRIIDCHSDNNKGVDFYSHLMQQEKRYLYRTIFLPHDARKRDGIIVENTYEREFKKLFSQTNTRFVILKQTDKSINITNSKIKFSRCVFNLNKTKHLLDFLMKYRKKWSEQYGKYLDIPHHDISSNYADAFQYAMQAVTHIETVGFSREAYQKHKAVIENRKYRV